MDRRAVDVRHNNAYLGRGEFELTDRRAVDVRHNNAYLGRGEFELHALNSRSRDNTLRHRYIYIYIYT